MDKTQFHQDEKQRIPSERHAGIVINNGMVLLIHRRRNGLEYYVFPGGHRRKGEKPEMVVLREIEEETAVIAGEPKLVFEFRDYKKDIFDFYYLCNFISGERPHLNGEEAIRNCEENFYEPLWVNLKEIEKLNILPKFAKEWLMETLLDKPAVSKEWLKK